MVIKHIKIITRLSILLAITLGIASYFGGFIPGTYDRDSASMAAQGIGQDIFDLLFVVPLLLISLLLMRKGKKVALFIFGGVILYITYSFFIYSFGVYFNHLFLFYCFTLGLSFYTFILYITALMAMDIPTWIKPRLPLRTVGIYFVVIAAMFYLLWFKDIIPAILTRTVPDDISAYHLLVNPVHVLDIAFMLPGLLITAFLLIKKQPIGLVLAPVLLVFIILLTLALIAMVIMLNVKGISEDISLVFIFIFLAILSSVFFFVFIKNLNYSK